MKSIGALIVDDEPLARQRVHRLLEEEKDITILGECGDGVDAISQIRSKKPDIVFLDVQMPEVDGFDVLGSLSQEDMPLVIFVTAYDQHAVRAFEVHAIDYLLKPFEDDRFMQSLQRAREVVQHGTIAASTQRLLELLNETRAERGGTKRIMVRAGGHISFLRTADIDWIEAQGDYVSLHCQGKRHLIRENIGDLELRVQPEGFIRIHRSTIINITRIKELQPLFHGDYTVVLVDGSRLTMSRSFRERFFERVGAIG
jgi:two-component system LytT family response regulator